MGVSTAHTLYILYPIFVFFAFFFWTLQGGRGHGHRLPTLSGNFITNINIISQHNSTTVKADGGQTVIYQYITNMLSKEVFNEAKFKRVNICTKRNIDETNLKQPKVYRKIYTSLWILNLLSKKSVSQKSQDFCQIFVIYKKAIPQGMDLKSIENLQDSLLTFILCNSHLSRPFINIISYISYVSYKYAHSLM